MLKGCTWLHELQAVRPNQTVLSTTIHEHHSVNRKKPCSYLLLRLRAAASRLVAMDRTHLVVNMGHRFRAHMRYSGFTRSTNSRTCIQHDTGHIHMAARVCISLEFLD